MLTMITIKNSFKFTQNEMRRGSKHFIQKDQLDINKVLKKETRGKNAIGHRKNKQNENSKSFSE